MASVGRSSPRDGPVDWSSPPGGAGESCPSTWRPQVCLRHLTWYPRTPGNLGDSCFKLQIPSLYAQGASVEQALGT